MPRAARVVDHARSAFPIRLVSEVLTARLKEQESQIQKISGAALSEQTCTASGQQQSVKLVAEQPRGRRYRAVTLRRVAAFCFALERQACRLQIY
jgi:hypothetical protein